MKDGLQGVSFDRWLMRIKDVLQIILTLATFLYGGYKYLKTVEQKDATISQQQRELIDLRTRIVDKDK